MLEGTKKTTNTVTFMSIRTALDLIEKLGYTPENVEIDSNGYQWDYWYEFEVLVDEVLVPFLIFGCGWDGTCTVKRNYGDE